MTKRRLVEPSSSSANHVPAELQNAIEKADSAIEKGAQNRGYIALSQASEELILIKHRHPEIPRLGAALIIISRYLREDWRYQLYAKRAEIAAGLRREGEPNWGEYLVSKSRTFRRSAAAGPVQQLTPPAQKLADLVQNLADLAPKLADPAQELAYLAQKLAGPARELADLAQKLADSAQESADPAQDLANLAHKLWEPSNIPTSAQVKAFVEKHDASLLDTQAYKACKPRRGRPSNYALALENPRPL